MRVREQMGAELEKARDAALDSARVKSEFLAKYEPRNSDTDEWGHRDGGVAAGHHALGQRRDFAETIRFSANALLTIINDILDFSEDGGRNAEVREDRF